MAFPVVALGACGSGGDKPAAAGGDTASPPAPSTAPQSPSPSPSTIPVPPGTPVVGPTGYKKIDLGMTEKQALATGMLGSLPPNGRHHCVQYPFKGGSVADGAVLISPDDGVVLITPPKGARTPEGIGIGSPLADVTQVYPELAAGGNGSEEAKVPQHPHYWYKFSFDLDTTKVNGLSLNGKGSCGG